MNKSRKTYRSFLAEGTYGSVDIKEKYHSDARSVKIFDRMDNLSSTQWSPDFMSIHKVRFLYFPKSKTPVVWSAGYAIHVEMIRALLKSDQFKNKIGKEEYVYEGFGYQNMMNRGQYAIWFGISHTMKGIEDDRSSNNFRMVESILSSASALKIANIFLPDFAGKLRPHPTRSMEWETENYAG